MGFPKLKLLPKYVPTALVVVLVLYLTLFPRPVGAEMVELFPGADKLIHAIMFGGLCGTYIYDRWRFGQPLGLAGALVAAIAVSLFGIVIEWLQSAMDIGRSKDAFDALADTLGAFFAVVVCGKLHWIDIIKHH